MTDNYVSSNTADNIYEEGARDDAGRRFFWNADTDSFITDKAVNLTESYGPYVDLRPPP